MIIQTLISSVTNLLFLAEFADHLGHQEDILTHVFSSCSVGSNEYKIHVAPAPEY